MAVTIVQDGASLLITRDGNPKYIPGMSIQIMDIIEGQGNGAIKIDHGDDTKQYTQFTYDEVSSPSTGSVQDLAVAINVLIEAAINAGDMGPTDPTKMDKQGAAPDGNLVMFGGGDGNSADSGVTVPVGGIGDMQKSVYDTDNNGIVDDSEELEGQPGSYYLDRANHTGAISDDEVGVQTIGTPTYTTQRDSNDVQRSTSLITGGGFTDNGDGTVDIDAGSVWIRSSDDPIAPLFSADFSAVASQALTDNANNFIYVEYNGGSPQVTVASPAPITDVHRNVILAVVYREGTKLYITEVNIKSSQVNQLIAKRLTFVDGITRQSGGLVTETGTRNIAISAGAFWLALTEFSTAAVDTSAAGTFNYYYQDGVGGWTNITSSTQIDNNQYDDGSGSLAALSNNRYGIHYVYLELNGDVHVVYGTDSYTLTDAQDAGLPVLLPPFITPFHMVLLAKVVICKSQSTFEEIQSAFETSFNLGLASNHNDLGLIQGGAVDDYQHLTTAELGVVQNTSGTNTGDQTITLTGDVTGSGTGSFAATIANDSVTNAKLDEMTNNTVKLRQSGTGNPTDLNMGLSTMLARLATGNIVAATTTQIQDLLKVQKHKMASSGSTFNTTSNTYVDVTSMSVTPDVAGDYFCIFQCSIKNSDDVNGEAYLRFWHAGAGDDTTTIGLVNSQFSGEPVLNLVMIKVYTFNGTTDELKVQTSDFGQGSGTTSIYGRSVTAIKVSD